MAKMLPSAHIVILLRDPIKRAISEFDDNCKNGKYIRLIKPILIPYLTSKIGKSNTITKKESKVNGNSENKPNIDEKNKEKENVMMEAYSVKEGKEGEEDRVRMFFLPEHSVLRMSSLQFILELSSASYYTSSTSSRHNTTHTTHNNTRDDVEFKSVGQPSTASTPPSFSSFFASLSSQEHSLSTFERTFFPLPPIDGYTVSSMWKINRNVLEQSIRILSSCKKKDFHDYYFGCQDNKNGDENENEDDDDKNKEENDKNGLRGSERGGEGGREKRYKNVLPLKHPKHYTDPVSSHSASSPSSSISASSISSSSLSSSSFTSSTPSPTSPPLLSLLSSPPSGSPTSSPLSSTSKEFSSKGSDKPSVISKKMLQNSPKLIEFSDNSSSSSSSSRKSLSNSKREGEGVMRRRLKGSQSHRRDLHNHSRQAHTPDNRHINIIIHTHSHADTDIDMTTHTRTDAHTDLHTDIHTHARTDSTNTHTAGNKRRKGSRFLLETNSTTHPQSPSTPTTAPNSNSRISSSSLSVSDSRISPGSVFEFNSMHFAAEERSHGLYDVLMERLMKR